jgi:hypothetical protein
VFDILKVRRYEGGGLARVEGNIWWAEIGGAL